MKGAYYNDNDPFVAAWLRNLIKAGHIPPGDVDDRSITDIRSDDLVGYTQCHFFAGLGGWAYALRLAGWEDDREVWTGSCPCQPFSVAGKRGGVSDPRHLWPEFQRLIAERRPPVIFGEQVAGASDWLRLVRSDLEEMDYAVGAVPIQAASCDAEHFRDRYWFVADHDGQQPGEGRIQRGRQQCGSGCDPEVVVGPMANNNRERPQIPVGEPSDAQTKCEAVTGNSVCDVGDLSGERGDWGENSAEQAGWFSSQVASFGGRYYFECPDGKWRRLPPPRVRWLGNGIPARVAQLRAFGNAIDPRPAAAFISAYKDVRGI